jgi:hypothetical protein
LTIAATTIILNMAANTAFAGFPRLAAIAAADGIFPATDLSRKPSVFSKESLHSQSFPAY